MEQSFDNGSSKWNERIVLPEPEAAGGHTMTLGVLGLGVGLGVLCWAALGAFVVWLIR
jgi:hypothetical protein